MAERETVHIYAEARGADVVVYAHSGHCLVTARDLALVMDAGVIYVSDDDGDHWVWRCPHRGPAKGEEK